MMMRVAQCVFLVCLLFTAYTYVFYPVALFFAYALAQVRCDWNYLTGRRNRRVSALKPEQLPTVTLIVPAYNEQACLPNKFLNLLQLEYPAEKIEVVFVSDGSTDHTNEILNALQHQGSRVVLLPERMGKQTP